MRSLLFLFACVGLGPLGCTEGGKIAIDDTGESDGEAAHTAREQAIRAVIDRTFPLEEIAAAHAYSETGRARGKIVISL